MIKIHMLENKNCIDIISINFNLVFVSNSVEANLTHQGNMLV